MFTYDNFVRIFDNINTSIHDTTIMMVIKSLALTFILLNIIKKLVDSKNSKNSDGATKVLIGEIVISFAYIIFILCAPLLLKVLDGFMGAVNDYIMARCELIKIELGVVDADASLLGMEQRGIAGICIKVVDFIGWLVNATAYPMFMIERGFLLVVLTIMLPFILALGALEKFRDIAWNWIRLYLAVFLTGGLFILANAIIEVARTQFFNILKIGLLQGQVLNGFSQVGLAIVFTFVKVRLYTAAVSISYKLFKC